MSRTYGGDNTAQETLESREFVDTLGALPTAVRASAVHVGPGTNSWVILAWGTEVGAPSVGEATSQLDNSEDHTRRVEAVAHDLEEFLALVYL